MPRALLAGGEALAFNVQHLRIDARAQALTMLLNHSLRTGSIEAARGRGAVVDPGGARHGPRTARAAGASYARRRLVDRVKLLLAGDLSRRWTLAGIAAEIGGSPVYLTQAFQQVEGMPLYRYHLRLGWHGRWISSRSARICRISPRIWASPATVISRRHSDRPME